MGIGAPQSVRPVKGFAAARAGVAASRGGAGGRRRSHPVTAAVVTRPDRQQTQQLVGAFDSLPEDQARAEVCLPVRPVSSLRRFIYEFSRVQAPHARSGGLRRRTGGSGRLLQQQHEQRKHQQQQ